jgi:hypothetical protein
MMHRIRGAMGKRDSLYNLEGMVEFDEGYFSTETSEKDKQNLKRGRGSQKQTNVAVMAESTPLEDLVLCHSLILGLSIVNTQMR